MKKIIHNKKLYVTVLLVILLFTIWYIGGSGKRVPQNMFKDIFGFELPESALFEEFDAKSIYNYNAKIVVKQSDLDYICEEFNKFYKKTVVREEERDNNKSTVYYDKEDVEGMRRIIDWFDLSYWDVDVCYLNWTTGKFGMGGGTETMVERWVFIRINDDDTATLYIAIYA